MKSAVEQRVRGTEAIVRGARLSLEFLDYLTFGLHRERFNLFNNRGLYLVWIEFLASIHLDFYKLSASCEKHSFRKLSNVLKEAKVALDYEEFDGLLIQFDDHYESTNFETVRSKFVAHQDFGVDEERSDLREVHDFVSHCEDLCAYLLERLDMKPIDVPEEPLSDFKAIFNEVDRFERALAVLDAARIRGYDSVKIQEVIDAINGNGA